MVASGPHKPISTSPLNTAATTLFAQETPTGEFLDLFTEDIQPKAISENGEWACGASLIDQYFTNAVKWNLTTGETIYLQDDEKAQSDPCRS